MEKWIVPRGPVNLRDFLSLSLGISKNKAKELIDSRCVYVNNKRVWIATHELRKDDVVESNQVIADAKKPRFEEELQVIFEDDTIVAVNKPAMLVTDQEKYSAETILRKKTGCSSLKAIHRLDKETSGVLLFAKNTEVYDRYVELWQDRAVKKTYLAICHNQSGFVQKKIDSEIEGRKAITNVTLLAKRNGFSYFEVDIETGRKHQIRIHLASIRHPIVGDKEYGLKKAENEYIKEVRRQLLHAYRLEFICPFTNQERKFFAVPPKDFIKFGKKAELIKE